MKKILTVLLVLALLLSGCGKTPPEPTAEPTAETTVVTTPAFREDAFRFTQENFPVLDGSTSMVPLGQGIASVLLGKDREAVQMDFHRTTASFRYLREGQSQVILAAEPSSTVFADMQEANFAWEMETIAKEALVFVVNADNPVNSLTREQVQGIYSGAITNWKEVGGRDMPIEAFQRNSTSGSQVMMEKLVMDGKPMMEAPTTNIPTEMGELILAVKGYDNTANAIGYTVYYYAADMQMAQGLKILKIDDILPGEDSIQSGAYPYVNGYYCCIAGDSPENSSQRMLYNWLVSEAGQNLLRLEGYIPVYPQGEAAEDGLNVLADYTNYAPMNGSKAVYTLRTSTMDALQPGKDYGLLHSYRGPQAQGVGEDSWMTAGMYGFCNAKGEKLTNPVYNGLWKEHVNRDYSAPYVWEMRCGTTVGFAAPDGSFVSRTDYSWVNACEDSIVCYRTDGSVDVYDWDYRLVSENPSFLDFDNNPAAIYDYQDGIFFGQTEQGCFQFDRWGQIYSGPWDWTYPMGHHYREAADGRGYELQNIRGEALTVRGERIFTGVSVLAENRILVTMQSGEQLLTDETGNVLKTGIEFPGWGENGFYLSTPEGKWFYDSQGRELYGRSLPGEWEALSGMGLVYRVDNDTMTVWDPNTDWTVEIPHGYAPDVLGRGEAALIWVPGETYWLLNRERELVPVPWTTRLVQDTVTGEPYLLMEDADGFAGECRILDMDGKTERFRCKGELFQIADGLVSVSDDWAFTILDMQGNVVFCQPFYGF